MKKSASPARAIVVPLTREQRVQYCKDLMAHLEWDRGNTGKLIAKEWGIAPTTVEDIAAEAWRRLKAEVTDPDRNATTANAVVHEVIRKAASRNELGTLLNAAKVLKDVTPQEAPAGARASLVSMSREERVRFLREALAEEEASLTDSPDSGISKP